MRDESSEGISDQFREQLERGGEEVVRAGSGEGRSGGEEIEGVEIGGEVVAMVEAGNVVQEGVLNEGFSPAVVMNVISRRRSSGGVMN